MVVLMVLIAGKIGAQCTGTVLWSTGAAPAPGASITIAGQWAGEHSSITGVVAGNTYSTSSSVGTDFITITSGTATGPVVAFGTSPISWIAPIAGTYFCHITTNSACGTQNSSRTLGFGCYPAGIPNDPCVNAISILPTGTYPGTTVGAALETPVPPACVTSAPSQGGVWYTVTGNGNRIGLSTTCGSAWDSKIWVYTGACGTNTCVTGNDDNGVLCTGVAASVAWCSQVGVQYRILVAGFSGPSAFTLVATQTVIATPTITASQNPICAGKTATLTGTGNTTFTWNPGALTGAAVAVTPAATTIYTLTGTASGCPAPAAFVTLTVNPNPTVTVNSGAICSSNSFTMVPTGGVTYTYSSGTAIVTPITTSNYTVTGSAANGCTNTAVSSVTVNASPTVAVNSGAICAGSSFTMVPTGGLTYTYSSGSAVVTPSANANYTVTGSNAAGCTNAAVSSVTVNATPTVVVANGSVCSGNSFTLSPTGATSYTYSTGPVVTPTATSSYTVTGSTSGCSSAPAVATVSVNTTPTVVVASGAICSGGSFTLNPTGASTYTYLPAGPVVSPTANASYSVTGTSAAGCISTSPAVSSVTVNSTPTITVAGGTICSGNSFTLSPSGASTYTFSSGPVVTPTANASYSVTGTSAAGCVSSAPAVASVSVNASPAVSAASSASLICAGQTATLTASGASTYTWNTAATTTVIAVSPTVTTSYTVTGSTNGCSNTFTISQSVSPCTGINGNTASLSSVLVYPNPNTGVFTVELNNGSVKNIEVMDLTGRIILSSTSVNDKVDFNINTLANGVYYVRIQSNNTVEVIKIVKQ